MANTNKFKKLPLKYEIVDVEDVIKETHFKNEEEIDICKDIIINLENSAAKHIKENKCVLLPFIGSIRINPKIKKYRENIKSIIKAKENGNEREVALNLIEKINKEIKEEEAENTKIRLIKNKNSSKYKMYYKTLGKAYADMYIASLFMMKGIEHNEEFDEIFKTLSD